MHPTREEDISYETHSTHDLQIDTAHEHFEIEDGIQHHVNIEEEHVLLRSIEPKYEKELATEYQK